MRWPTNLSLRDAPILCLAGALLLGAVRAEAQTVKGGKIDPTWLRGDAATKTAEFKLVGGLTDLNGGMNFNGFSRGALVLTVPQGWAVVLHFKNQDPNLPHSVEIIPDADAMAVRWRPRSNTLLPVGSTRAFRRGRARMCGSWPGRLVPSSSFAPCLATALLGCGSASPLPRVPISRLSRRRLSADGARKRAFA